MEKAVLTEFLSQPEMGYIRHLESKTGFVRSRPNLSESGGSERLGKDLSTGALIQTKPKVEDCLSLNSTINGPSADSRDVT